MQLLTLNNVIEGTVVKRPSKFIKTPYVADVKIDNESNELILAHTASLGCCGLADIDATILMSPMPIPKNKNNKQKCQYRIYLSVFRDSVREKEIIVGIHPKLAEDLVESALQKNYLSILKNIKSYKRETSIYLEGKVDSRFDFTGIDNNGCPFIMEVKNVPLADYEDVCKKDRKDYDFTGRDFNSKVAYFPDGYRKKSTDTVSPRALKHIRELIFIKSHSKTRCIMCYVIQRTDVDRFTASIIDQEYKNAFNNAIESGVEIITMVVKWNKNDNNAVAEFICDNLSIV
jgi:DNA-binding sugar fermentation-stimulating protein